MSTPRQARSRGLRSKNNGAVRSERACVAELVDAGEARESREQANKQRVPRDIYRLRHCEGRGGKYFRARARGLREPLIASAMCAPEAPYL